MAKGNKIIPLNNITTLDIPVERVLESAKEHLNGVVIMGFDKNDEFYAASTYADGGAVLWLIELLKKKLMEEL